MRGGGASCRGELQPSCLAQAPGMRGPARGNLRAPCATFASEGERIPEGTTSCLVRGADRRLSGEYGMAIRVVELRPVAGNRAGRRELRPRRLQMRGRGRPGGTDAR